MDCLRLSVMKILLSTYSCFPTKTPKPGNPGRAINEALREHEVWAVIADAHRHRELMEPILQKNPLPNFHPVFFKLSPAFHWLRRGHFYTFHYHIWQQQLRGFVAELHRKIGFDLVHHVTLGRYWSPS